MQKLLYALQLGLVTGLCLVLQPTAFGRSCARPLAPAVPEITTKAGLSAEQLSPPELHHRRTRLRRDANPASGFGRDYFRPHRLRSQRKPDSFGVRAQYWWSRHRPR